jgi:hypothetical protein
MPGKLTDKIIMFDPTALKPVANEEIVWQRMLYLQELACSD